MWSSYSFYVSIVLISLLLLLIILMATYNYYYYQPEVNDNQVTSAVTSSSLTTFSHPIYLINLERYPERLAYVQNQLQQLNLTHYQLWPAVDGFNLAEPELISYGLAPELTARKGLAGCAASHLSLWRHLAQDQSDWVLILEDDVHFHPNFVQLFGHYWSALPAETEIVFVGHCGNQELEKSDQPIVMGAVMCLHGYLLNGRTAAKLLKALVPVKEPIDIALINYYQQQPERSAVFNGNAIVNGIRPNDYKEANGSRCLFNGLLYQNQQEQGSTIHGPDLVREIQT